MTIWSLIRWVWRLEAPLFIGMPPAGTLNRCRLYVSARAIHGALTAELARLKGNEKSEFPDYGKFGREVGINCHFTYLYPAEKSGDKFLAWLPKFQKAEGLRWCRQDGKKPLSDRKFRQWLLDTRSGTAITPETDSSSEGTLREMECINPRWRDRPVTSGGSDRVYLMGYLFLKNNYLNGNSQKRSGPDAGKKQLRLRDIKTLYVGGDSRYGLGKICLEKWHDLSGNAPVFGKPVALDRESPEIQSDIVWGHVPENGQTAHVKMIGAKEQFDGWEIKETYKGKLTWIPGSAQDNDPVWQIDRYGYWILK